MEKRSFVLPDNLRYETSGMMISFYFQVENINHNKMKIIFEIQRNKAFLKQITSQFGSKSWKCIKKQIKNVIEYWKG